MANNVLFIKTDYLKKKTAIQKNVEDDLLVTYILKVGDVYLQQTLGTAFYVHLQQAKINNNFTADELTLVRDYIQPMVAEYTYYEVFPHLNYKTTNKAISQESSEFSQPSTLDEIKYIRNSIRNVAEFYDSRLRKYLCDYSNLFPIFQNPGDKENLKKNNGSSYFSGIGY